MKTKMAESKTHSESVRIGIDYIKSIAPMDIHCLIQSDLPETRIKPERTIDNFVPDIRLETDQLKIIGEAKTDEDTMRNHSLQQYDSYLKECQCFPGSSHLVIVTSFYAVPSITNYIRRKKKELSPNTKIHIINSTFKNMPKIL